MATWLPFAALVSSSQGLEREVTARPTPENARLESHCNPVTAFVSGDAGRWMQYRYKVDGTITGPRYHVFREAALRQAARLANHEGVRLFVWEKPDNGTCGRKG